MDMIDFFKKLTVGFAIGSVLTGTVVAVVGLYLKIFNVSVIGFFLILISVLIMHILFRKFGEV